MCGCSPLSVCVCVCESGPAESGEDCHCCWRVLISSERNLVRLLLSLQEAAVSMLLIIRCFHHNYLGSTLPVAIFRNKYTLLKYTHKKQQPRCCHFCPRFTTSSCLSALNHHSSTALKQNLQFQHPCHTKPKAGVCSSNWTTAERLTHRWPKVSAQVVSAKRTIYHQ